MPSEEKPVKGTTRPVALKPQPATIPAELKARPRWVCWRYYWQQQSIGMEGRWKKPPFDPCSGRAAQVTVPETWSTYEDAASIIPVQGTDGVGLVLVDERGGEGEVSLYVIDIDHCRNPETGAIDGEAWEIILRMNTYTEVSPSGQGVHIWFFADLPQAGRRKGRYEIYGAGRYMTVTGILTPGSFPSICVRRNEAAAIYGELFDTAVKTTSPTVQACTAPVVGDDLGDDEILSRAGAGVGRQAFAELYSGGKGRHGSDSEADMAFCARLAFFTKDPVQIVRLWMGSGRWRSKCKTHPTYAMRTAQKAIDTQPNYRDPGFRLGSPPDAKVAVAVMRDHQVSDAAPNPPPVSEVSDAPSTPPPASSPPAPVADQVVPEHSTNRTVRRLADVEEEAVSWFLRPWIPKGELSFVVGTPGCGKSTFLAHLVSLASAAVLMPGHEESVNRMLASRLRANGAKAEKVHLLEGSGWTLPSNVKRVIEEVRKVKAELVVMDPIDSYLDEGMSENDGAAVRLVLESAVKVANETGCAVVAVRHPGKDPNNICPGSRSWRAVPRMIVQLLTDLSTPPKRFLHAMKDSLGACPPDTYYELASQGDGKPRLFRLGSTVRAEDSEIARSVSDRQERKKLDVASDLLKQLLSEGEEDAGWILQAAQKLGISAATCYMAAERLGVGKRSEGGGKNAKHWWTPPKVWPE